MLKPKTLANVLSQANTQGVQCTLLLNREGTLLAYSGYGDKDARMAAAISSSIWISYEKFGKTAYNEDNLNCFFLACENGHVIVQKVANVLLAMLAKNNVPLGILRAKMNALAEYLESPLKLIASS